MKKWSLLVASVFLLAACSNEEAEPAETEEPEKAEMAVDQESMTEEGFITQVSGESILVNNIYFSIPEDVKVQFSDGAETTEGVIRDIRTGMKVSMDYQGPLAESFPMQGEAETITILTDEDSVEQSEALEAFINTEQLSRLIMMGQPIVRDNEIGFLFSNMETGEMSEVRIDLDTHEYTIGGEENE
ncbi:hypothetical protein A1A1_17505 [Planococcus antarcticus DSM 14505]|uniref:DUF3221 domain-containing protein n=1 Tax=Planococcus antarcticus DSM 14505 TaxID=1185653 RepID=A0A1C7DHT8_9BACL|nr:DUF3221 domain-containing protein [Planococcus antarcticus]ANU11120.1 hypothetical protein BBH88_12850 [Planococcus antarcticus DSM 14505]EIM05199.1 hypothetical protein A1A1_17505 [Planococcus antarcticus DSM 14505]